ncbi:CRISPR-associated endonuclease Csy4 [Oceanospirillum multiglobuliferum]|uniref:Type I-F CRISPR-associated endoribonuclease Cas6/Csy4 n=1 Tax=Oceanospirillum multiglobuliferum TaxID=64969 RepID=A0A1T4P1X7_9GAMM|nr:type I-F CRISPR-associated endoribonuclease Cas6/Csy4 [Oceanospirillum multiglobuliferum]OPX55110.1 type I-F CRISPR-associated endoribonuclease Cas6/Csy4 [Oceanospirillum multiglobuliferum]SJZ85620.1 CRISPR-associated endonuclease Csy4 [Oceanospirillum multiglobuliferum]
MNYYQDITLLPDTDIALGFLWQKIYQQVHIALVENKVDQHHSVIAVSFPAYGGKGFPLGNKLRVLAKEKAQLEKLNLAGFLARFEDYTHLKSIQPVPEDVPHIAFVRQRVKGQTRIDQDMASKAKRWAEKSGQTVEECLQQLAKTKPFPHSSNAFIWMESLQTKASNPEGSAKFPLFIEKVEVNAANQGLFNCYGLSAAKGDNIATVPNF